MEPAESEPKETPPIAAVEQSPADRQESEPEGPPPEDDIPDAGEPTLSDLIVTIQRMTQNIDERIEARRLLKLQAEKMLKKL